MNLAKNHDFTEYSFHQIVISRQQNNVDQSALVKNMMSQLSMAVSDVILSFPEHKF